MTTPAVRKRTRPASGGGATKSSTRVFPFSTSGECGVEARIKEYVNPQALVDPFNDVYATDGAGALDIIRPPFNLYALARLPFENSTLLQCIDAMVCNCDSHGWSLEYVGPDGQIESVEAQSEKDALEKLLKFPNVETNLLTLRQRLRFDKEAMGVAYMEVGRDRKGRVAMLNHVPAHTVRRTLRDRAQTEYAARLPRDGSDTTTIRRRFCRYVQDVNGRKVYFKEYGDPRPIDSATGKVNEALPYEEQATEIIYLGNYNPTSPYGAPRWINQLPSVLGSRQAELTNLDFFKDNAIPAMAVMVSGGALTQDTLDRIGQQLMAIKGREAVHRMVVLEAKGDEDAAADTGQIPPPKIEMKPLRDAQQGDAMFQNYEKDSTDKIRSSFRLPPLFIGRSEDMTYATASTSYDVAESQVFGSERGAFDALMDSMVLATYGARFWAFRSNPAKITNPQEVVDALRAFDTMGALTPNVVIKLANEYFDLEIDTIQEDWGDFPFSIVQTLAGAGKLKGLEGLVVEPDDDLTDDQDQSQEAPEGTNPDKPNPNPDPEQVQENPEATKAKVVKHLLNVHALLSGAQAA